MTRLLLTIALLVALFDAPAVFARSSGSSSHSSRGTIQVHGYTRKDGTHVQPYLRHAPGTENHTLTTTPAARVHQPNIYSAHVSSGFVGVRDAHGRIIRSEAAKRAFMRMTGYPHGRPGYVVDHVVALKRGGADAPGNMQWQTIADAKAKDRWE
jgi:hypothetical protein